MIPRTPEPEVMSDASEADEYDRMDHSEVNNAFVRDFVEACNGNIPESVLDVGTGTALIPIAAVRAYPAMSLVAVDQSREMLIRAAENIENAGLCDRIRVLQHGCRELAFDDNTFDATISNSLIHHLNGPSSESIEPVAISLSEMIRVTQPGGTVFVRDLCRPESVKDLEQLVETYAGRETSFAQQLFRQSLHAAFTVDEVTLALNGLPFREIHTHKTTDRHWTLVGTV